MSFKFLRASQQGLKWSWSEPQIWLKDNCKKFNSSLTRHCATKILQCRRDGSIPRRSWFSHFNSKRKKCWSWPCGIFASCKPANFSLLKPSEVRSNKNYSSKQHKKSRTTYPPIPRSSVYLKQNRPKLQLWDDHLVK